MERSSEDPAVVITTYEGQHTHPSPLTQRASFGILADHSNHGFVLQQPHPYQQHAYMYNASPSLNITTSNSFSPNLLHERRMDTSPSSQSCLLRDHGLLQDIVPTQMRKEPKEE